MGKHDIINEIYLQKALYYYDFDMEDGIIHKDIIDKYEHKTSSLDARLENIASTAGENLTIKGLCFSTSLTNLAILAIGVFLGGVDE